MRKEACASSEFPRIISPGSNIRRHAGICKHARPVEESHQDHPQSGPDAFFPSSRSEYVRWPQDRPSHGANNTLDAIRAAEWHLYFPNQRLHEGLEPFIVPQEFYYYVTDKDANKWVNIDSVVETKLDAPWRMSASGAIHHKYVPIGTGGSRKDQGRKCAIRSPRKTGTTWKRFAPPSIQPAVKIRHTSSRDRETTLFSFPLRS